MRAMQISAVNPGMRIHEQCCAGVNPKQRVHTSIADGPFFKPQAVFPVSPTWVERDRSQTVPMGDIC